MPARRDRLRSRLDVPIDGKRAERRALLIGAAVLTLLVLVVSTLTSGDDNGRDRPAQTTTRTTPQAPPIIGIEGERVAGTPEPTLDQAARRFFGSWLRHMYTGRGRITNATPRLTRQLRREPALGLRLDPRVVEVRTATGPAGEQEVTALIDDGRASAEQQRVAARFRQTARGWVAIAIAGER